MIVTTHTQACLLPEEILIGSIIVAAADGRRKELDWIFNHVSSQDFVGDTGLGKLYSGLLDAFDSGEQVGDIPTVRAIVQQKGLVNEIDGSRLAGILKQASSSPIFYAKKVRGNAQLNRLESACLEVIGNARAKNANPSEVTQKAVELIEAICTAQPIEPKKAGDVAAEIAKQLDDQSHSLIGTGLSKFDDVIGGLSPGELVTIAARTSVGKSALAVQISEYVSLHHGPVLFLSLEMSEADIVARMVAGRCGVGVKELRGGNLDESQKRAARQAASDLANSRLHIRYLPGVTVREVRRIARGFKAQHGVSLVVIDYLQILGRPDYRQATREALAESTRTLKQLAGELSCPVLALSQLNRESTKQDSPSLANLSESSSIEADSDCVLAIHRPDLQSQDCSMLVLKNRNGVCCELAGMKWDGTSMRFDFPVNRFSELD